MKADRFVILGAADGPRITAFQSALADLQRPPAQVVSYSAFLDAPDRLVDVLGENSTLRFDSPDRDAASLSALYAAGAERAAAAGFSTVQSGALESTAGRRGMIGSPTQLWYGLCQALQRATEIATQSRSGLLAEANEIAKTFDKALCAEHLQAHGISVPKGLGPVEGYDGLLSKMRHQRQHRVFVKLRHGSSAAGMVALALGPRDQVAAYTTAVFDSTGELCATRRIRRLTRHKEIAQLIDAMAPLGALAQEWVPKAGIEGGRSDLRIIVIAGEPRFNIMRLSQHPMTNLHLGAKRQAPDGLRKRVGPKVWSELMDSCRAVARLFPNCLMLGIDAAILAGDRRHAVLEVNAFGDHVNDLRYRGMTPQGWQILKADDWLAA